MFRIRKILPGEFAYVAQPTTTRLTKSYYPLYFSYLLLYPNLVLFSYLLYSTIHNLFTSHSHFIHTFLSNLWYNYLNMKTNVNFFHILPYSKIFVHIVLLVIFFLYKHELYKNKFNIMEAIIL